MIKSRYVHFETTQLSKNRFGKSSKQTNLPRSYLVYINKSNLIELSSFKFSNTHLSPPLYFLYHSMGTLDIQTPTPNTIATTTAKFKDPEKNHLFDAAVGNVDEDELPEEVRRTVANTDDHTLPVWTFRMWFLGLLSCALLSFLNQFFAYRTEPLIITQITVQVATLPIGRFMAAVLPKTKFQIPGLGSQTFSINPGPFNMKEHVLISIFANAGTAFGSGTAYAVGIVTIIKAFYGRNISFVASWLLITTTQVRVIY